MPSADDRLAAAVHGNASPASVKATYIAAHCRKQTGGTVGSLPRGGPHDAGLRGGGQVSLTNSLPDHCSTYTDGVLNPARRGEPLHAGPRGGEHVSPTISLAEDGATYKVCAVNSVSRGGLLDAGPRGGERVRSRRRRVCRLLLGVLVSGCYRMVMRVFYLPALLSLLACIGAPASECECTYEGTDSGTAIHGETEQIVCTRVEPEESAERLCATNTFLGNPTVECECDCVPSGKCGTY